MPDAACETSSRAPKASESALKLPIGACQGLMFLSAYLPIRLSNYSKSERKPWNVSLLAKLFINMFRLSGAAMLHRCAATGESEALDEGGRLFGPRSA